ncbi:hypothetical protein [Paracoccus cavernae]|uniref:hypothetical protein n=1 Tax=Paracoccus cavernae TaxID=1571207 RepID=UPI0035F4FB16
MTSPIDIGTLDALGPAGTDNRGHQAIARTTQRVRRIPQLGITGSKGCKLYRKWMLAAIGRIDIANGTAQRARIDGFCLGLECDRQSRHPRADPDMVRAMMLHFLSLSRSAISRKSGAI